MNIRGGCHCGNIALELDWPDDAPLPVRRCGCSFCRTHSGEWTSHPDATLAVSVRSVRDLSRYRFGTATADFLICARCGLVPAVVSRIDGRDYAVVNVRTLELDGVPRAATQDTDFDAEDRTERLDRRRRNWIARVELDFDPPA